MAFLPPLSHCAALVRTHDHDRYLCSLFADTSAREAWFALFAFNHEIAAIAESVSEEMIGFMRFAWWREALDEIREGKPVRRHPVVEALAYVWRAYRLDPARFAMMLDTREAALAGDTPAGAVQWETYFSATSGALFQLCALGENHSGSTLDALGIAWAATGTARACSLRDDTATAGMLMGMAQEKLQSLQGLPPSFAPFEHAARFYLARLKAGKPSGASARLPLMLHLYTNRWRRYLRL